MEQIIHRPGQADLHQSDSEHSNRTAAQAREDDQKSSGEHWVKSGPSSTARERGAKLMGTLPVTEKPQLVPKPTKAKPGQEPQETWRGQEAA